jgi:hypothetical protein
MIGELEEEDMSAIAMIVIQKKIPTNDISLVTLVT